jgi:hypothetical protein
MDPEFSIRIAASKQLEKYYQGCGSGLTTSSLQSGVTQAIKNIKCMPETAENYCTTIVRSL